MITMATIYIYWHDHDGQQLRLTMRVKDGVLGEPMGIAYPSQELRDAIDHGIKMGHDSVQWPGGHYSWEIKEENDDAGHAN